MKKKIIFLDIDGVLNSKAYFDSIKESEIPATEKIHIEISEYHVKLLSELCHACDAKIVLASTWKELDDDFNRSEYQKYGLENILVQTKFFVNKISDGGLQQKHVSEAIYILNERK